ncbi:hypothetical protein PG994_008379 [Apiospora phragmitis]|uniref:Uncharacterized protein n=1 Tax=Apiospora phragmitis TaxID=2905665 RepID=A0ABR1UW07_9PEZI
MLRWWTPKIVGEGCKPGTAQRGTELFLIEREIRERLAEEPDFEDLEKMKAYVEAMDFLQKDGTKINVFFVDRCMKHWRPRPRAAPSIASGASRTTASEMGSVSPSTPPTSSSVADSSPASEIVSLPFHRIVRRK